VDQVHFLQKLPHSLDDPAFVVDKAHGVKHGEAQASGIRDGAGKSQLGGIDGCPARHLLIRFGKQVLLKVVCNIICGDGANLKV